MLLYADDIVLIATREDLQKQLDALHSFCECHHMQVNVAKTKVLVFNGGKWQLPVMSFRG